MNILINGVGGPTPRSIARTLKRFGKREYKLFGTDINPLAYGLYEKNLYEKTYVIPSASKEGYWKALEQIVKRHQIDLALVQPELEVMAWAKRQSEGQALPVRAFLPNYSVAELLVDKARMTEILQNTGLVPKSLNIDPDYINQQTIENQLGYPFWIRSTSGSSGLGSLKVENYQSLLNWFTINPNVKQFIGSTYLPGRNLACKVLYYKGSLVRAACGERVNYIMSKIAPSGITGNTSFGRLLNEPDLIEQTKVAMAKIFEATGTKPYGFYTADFKEDEQGKPFITEINVRMVAFNLSYAAAGANFTQDIVDLLTAPEEFDKSYKMYQFEPDTIFLRDVDAEPILMKETDLKLPGV